MVNVARRGRPSLVIARGSSAGGVLASAVGEPEGSDVAGADGAALGAEGAEGAEGVAGGEALGAPLHAGTSIKVATTTAMPGSDRWRAMPSTVRRAATTYLRSLRGPVSFDLLG